MTKLFDQRPDLANAPTQPMWPREIKSRDGHTLVSYLTLPPGSDSNKDGVPDKPVPLVLNVHGGPWARDSFGFDPEHQWLANRGYAVLSVNFRGSTGFGKAFINAADREWAGKMHDDLHRRGRLGGARRRSPIADKVAIYGGSYGGYATLVGPDVHAGEVRLRCGYRRALEPCDPARLDPAVLEVVLRGPGEAHRRPAHGGGPQAPRRALAAHPRRIASSGRC